MPFTYSGDPSSSDRDSIRFEIQDTDQNAQLLQDAEIEWTIVNETGIAPETPAALQPGPLYAAAARCCEALSRRFAAQADTVVGDLQTTYSKQSVTYAARAKELRAKSAGFQAPYAGGQSISEKQGLEQNTDKVLPAFRRGEFDSPYAGEGQGGSREDLGAPLR